MDNEWQLALSKAVEKLQRLRPLDLTHKERSLATTYIRQAEQALSRIAGSCPHCGSPPGARHHCGKIGYRTFDEMGIPPDDPRRNNI